MILNVHKEKTDTLVLSDVANEFVSKSERRQQVFLANFKILLALHLLLDNCCSHLVCFIIVIAASM